MSNKPESAVATFNLGFNCAQAVFSTYCEKFGLDQETAKKISCGFGAGMAYTGETCGAVTGALMLIGLKHGKVKVEDNQSKEKTYSLVKEFSEKFKALHGSVSCSELLGCDISIPDELQKAREQNLFGNRCTLFVRDASRIVEELLST